MNRDVAGHDAEGVDVVYSPAILEAGRSPPRKDYNNPGNVHEFRHRNL